jgi:hypothetical protein
MADIFRDSPLGQIIRLVTRNKVLQYPEEKDSFTCLYSYGADRAASQETDPKTTEMSPKTSSNPPSECSNKDPRIPVAKTRQKRNLVSPTRALELNLSQKNALRLNRNWRGRGPSQFLLFLPEPQMELFL